MLSQLRQAADESPPDAALGGGFHSRGLAAAPPSSGVLALPSGGGGATRREGMHGIVDEALFCLSLLPATAAPSVLLLSDAVASALGSPSLPLRQADVCLIVVLLTPSARAPSHPSSVRAHPLPSQPASAPARHLAPLDG